MAKALSRFELEGNNFIFRVPFQQLNIAYDPHRLEEYAAANEGAFPSTNDWKHTTLYTTFINVWDLYLGKDVLLPMKKNPRNQNLKSTVSNNIASALINDELDVFDNESQVKYPVNESFYINNRGIALVAHKVNKLSNVSFYGEDSIVHDNVLEIIMDKEKEGNIDGGHTYKIILEQVEGMLKKEKEIKSYVRLEINVNLLDVTTFAAARNTNAAVKEASIMNSRGEFDTLKMLLRDLPFFPRIAYRQNDKGIPIENIVEYIELFNLRKSPQFETNDNLVPPPFVPKQKWGASKRDILKSYSEEINSAIIDERPSEYDLMESILPDLFWLYTEIERNIPTIYNKYANGKRGARFGTTNYVSRNQTKEKLMDGNVKYRQLTTYSDGDIKKENAMLYVIDKGLVVPIAAMFRMLLDKHPETDQYYWINNLSIRDHAEEL